MVGLRLAFMGTPEFSAHVLKALISSEHEIACVYSQPPRPAGRGRKLVASAVQQLAENSGIEVRTPVSLKADDVKADFSTLNLDVAVVVAYGLILPAAILEAPVYGCLNLHASLLPRWRGAAPIQRAIMAGDVQTGVAVMQMAAGLDTGDILRETRLPITETATAGTLQEKLATAGTALMLDTLARLVNENLIARPQATDGITYAEKILKSEAAIDWCRPAIEIDRQVRGLNPAPGAYFEHNGERIKLLQAKLAPETGKPGEVLDDTLTVACGDGALQLLKLQRAGKGAMPADVFLNGHAIKAGEFLS